MAYILVAMHPPKRPTLSNVPKSKNAPRKLPLFRLSFWLSSLTGRQHHHHHPKAGRPSSSASCGGVVAAQCQDHGRRRRAQQQPPRRSPPPSQNHTVEPAVPPRSPSPSPRTTREREREREAADEDEEEPYIVNQGACVRACVRACVIVSSDRAACLSVNERLCALHDEEEDEEEEEGEEEDEDEGGFDVVGDSVATSYVRTSYV